MVDKTNQQESASLWFFEKALKYNKTWKDLDDLISDRKSFNELCSVYPALKKYNSKDIKSAEFAKEWINIFIAQQKEILKRFGKPEWRPFDEFVRNGNFMDYITKAVHKVYGIAKKDTWDPADVWCIRHQPKAKKELEKVLGKEGDWGNETPPGTIDELNNVLRNLYQNGKKNEKAKPAIVGISLKKVSTQTVVNKVTGEKMKIPTVHFEEVNITANPFRRQEYKKGYGLQEIGFPCRLHEDNQGWEGKEGYVIVLNTFVEPNVQYRFRLAPMGKNGRPGKLKFEPSQLGTAAQLGQTPTDMIPQVFMERGLDWDNNPNSVATDLASYVAASSKYKRMWQDLKTAGTSGIFKGILNMEKMGRSAIEFDRAVKHLFTPKTKRSELGMRGGDDPSAAQGKLMQLALFHACLKLAESDKNGMTKLNQVWTDFTFFAQKKRRSSKDKFGPFGKIY